MKRNLAQQFNDEVERYRRTLLYFSRTCEWDKFKARAASLFEYLELVEASERERRFYATFYAILGAIVICTLALFGLGSRIQEVLEHRHLLILVPLAGCSFEIFFYLNFRWYVEIRMAGFRRRREAFIRNIENDFRSFQETPGIPEKETVLPEREASPGTRQSLTY